MDAPVELTPGAEMPDLAFRWRDSNGDLIPFATEPHTFSLRIGTPPLFVKGELGGDQSGIVAVDSDPNVTIAWATGELDQLPTGFFSAQLWAQRTSDGRRRSPLRFDVQVNRRLQGYTDSAALTAAATVTVTDTLT